VISSPSVTLCLFYLLAAVVASALLRTASTPFAVKVIVPSCLVALACVTYVTLPEMFGFPVETSFSALPPHVELIAYVPHDDEKKVDLWLVREGSPQPRSYSVELTDDLKDTLRKAQKAKADGSRVMLTKGKPGKKRPHEQYSDIDGGESPYVLQENAFQLPSKDAAK
jgi:hypothetical protein